MQRFIYIILLIPFFAFSQTNDCGKKPKKPKKTTIESQAEYKQSDKYLDYKKNLKIWKACISPLQITKAAEEEIKRKKEALRPPCGDKPKKPKRAKGLSNDEFRKTAEHIAYRKKVKVWKACIGPMGITKREKEAADNKQINPCGDKPEKPIRAQGQTADQYRGTPEHKEYREKMKIWKACISPMAVSERYDEKNRQEKEKINPCGDQPEKPIRNEGQSRSEYKSTSEYVEYQKNMKTWKACVSPLGISKRYDESISK